MVSNQEKAGIGKNVLVIVLLVVLIAMVGLFLWQRRDHKLVVDQINTEKDSIQSQLQRMVVNYDSIKTDNEALNNSLLMTQTEIKSLLSEVEQVKRASLKEINEYRDKVNTLRAIMKDLYYQLDSMNTSNQLLLAENQQVKQQITDERSKNEQLVKEKNELEQTVKKAQILEALNLTVTGLTPRDKETMKVARAQKLMISFTLSKNLTAVRGAKQLYVRIMRPDQLLMSNSDNDLFQFEDLKIPFSAMREVNYEGMELPVNIYWDNEGHDAFMAGTYTVDVFADGYNIGTGKFIMSK